MVFGDKDLVGILESVLSMVLSITKEVYESIEFGWDYYYEKKPAKEKSDAIDKLNLCAVYIDMGIINITTTALCAFGAVAAETPKFQLKGSGDIILKSAAQKELYVTKNVTGGGPTGAIHETIDTVAFVTKFAIKAIDLGKEAAKLGKASKSATNPLTEQQEKDKKAEKNRIEGDDLL